MGHTLRDLGVTLAAGIRARRARKDALSNRSREKNQPRRQLSAAISCAALLISSIALAEPLPLERSVEVGRPPRAIAIRVVAGADGALLVLPGGQSPLPVPEATEATIERVAVGHGAVAIVRVRGGGREAAAIVASGRAPLWLGRLDWHGDPGEREADALDLSDRTGDGVPDLVVGVRSEAARICGQDDTLLFARAVDPALVLRPVVLRRVPAAPGAAGEQTATATATSPGPTAAPLIGGLRFTGASSSSGAPESPSAVPAPRVLERGEQAGSFWAEGRGGDGRGEFVTARWDSPLPIRAIAITPSPADAALAARLGRPRTLWVVGDGGARIRITLPEDALRRPGERYWVVPSAPVAWRCLSVVLDESYAPTGVPAAEVRTALAGVEAYTDADFGGGIPALVELMANEGPDAERMVAPLAALGPRAIDAVLASWPRLGPLGKRRAVRVLAASVALPRVLEALTHAARDEPDEQTRAQAVATLARAGDAGIEALGTLAREPGPTGDAAAVALARQASETAILALCSAFTGEGASERPVLRTALRDAILRGGDHAPAAVRSWVETWLSVSPTTDLAAAASMALGLAPSAPTRPTAELIVRTVARAATRFEDRWRLVGAASHLGAEPEVDAWLGELATSADEWMLRDAALAALAERGASAAPQIATHAADDPYPRVRARAAAVLARTTQGRERVRQLATGDRFPLVRAAATAALARTPLGAAVARRALADNAISVRTAGVRAIAESGDRSAWPLVAERLEDDDEWPSVIAEGVGLARARCIQEAAAPLGVVLRRGLRPDAWAPDVDLATLALRALVALGGEPGEEALRVASRATSPGALRAAVPRLRSELGICRRARRPGSDPGATPALSGAAPARSSPREP